MRLVIAVLSFTLAPGEVIPNGTPAIVVPWTVLDELLAPGAYAIGAWD